MSDKNDDVIYVVYRVYSSDERPDPSDRSRFYGWSTSKSVVKALLEQRSSKKYKYREIDERDRHYFPEIDDRLYMIDFAKLKSAKTREDIIFFTTLSEMKEAEIKIQERFHELSSMDNMDAVKAFMHIDRYYLDALEFIGFRPKQIDAIYDTSDPMDNYNTFELVSSEIEDAYDGAAMAPSEDDDFVGCMNPPGLMTISQIADKVLYSMENFVTALLEDL